MNEKQIEKIVSDFEEMGYLKFVSQDEIERVRSIMRSNLKAGKLSADLPRQDGSGHFIMHSSDYRCYSTDAEDLAEGGIEVAIKLMSKTLEKEGVTLDEIKDVSQRGNSYAIEINGHTYDIIPPEGELEWDTAHLKLLEIVNDLLQKAKSKERLYAVYGGGNDAESIFLTNEMYDYIKSKSELFDKEWVSSLGKD